jgi:hypothetical protein
MTLKVDWEHWSLSRAPTPPNKSLILNQGDRKGIDGNLARRRRMHGQKKSLTFPSHTACLIFVRTNKYQKGY